MEVGLPAVDGRCCGRRSSSPSPGMCLSIGRGGGGDLVTPPQGPKMGENEILNRAKHEKPMLGPDRWAPGTCGGAMQTCVCPHTPSPPHSPRSSRPNTKHNPVPVCFCADQTCGPGGGGGAGPHWRGERGFSDSAAAFIAPHPHGAHGRGRPLPSGGGGGGRSGGICRRPVCHVKHTGPSTPTPDHCRVGLVVFTRIAPQVGGGGVGMMP